MPTSTPPRHQNFRDQVAGIVRDRVLDGTLRPGDRIDQDGLAEELHVSKLPVREALIQLEWMGLIRTIPYRGSFVVELEPADLRDTYYVYGTVCGLAARRAVDTLSADDLDRLGALLDAIDEHRDTPAIDAEHMQFHRLINRAGTSRRMRRIIGQVYDSLPVRTFDFTRLWFDGAQRDHRAILTHLRAGDHDAAEEATLQHFIAGGERVIEALTAQGYWAATDPPQAPE